MRGQTDTHPERERDTKRDTETPRDTVGVDSPPPNLGVSPRCPPAGLCLCLDHPHLPCYPGLPPLGPWKLLQPPGTLPASQPGVLACPFCVALLAPGSGA